MAAKVIQEQPSEKPSSLSKFKIPKKKKPEVDSDEVDKKSEATVKEPEETPPPQITTDSNISNIKILEETSTKPPTQTNNDGSDSEPELKIAESDHEEETKREKDDTEATIVKGTIPEPTPKDENERGQLTKAMLQNIVASIGK